MRGQVFRASEFRILSVAEQAADYLREQILRGRWSDEMPGRHELAAELGINHKTVEAALNQMEAQGLVTSRGSGRRRHIAPPDRKRQLSSLRIAILTGMGGDRMQEYMVETKHQLIENGHAAFYTEQSLNDLGMDVRRVARMVEKTKVDAWVVVAGSREVLEWFAAHPVPAFAFFGRRRKLRIAGCGPDKSPAYAAATRALLEFGHRRIVLLSHAERRLPLPGASERAFLEELEAAGITPGPYHFPDWEETPDGFHARLVSLFHLTPPTALIVDTVPLFSAVEEFLARRGLRVPEDVSLVSTEASNAFAWRRRPVTHIRWDSRQVVRRVVNWAANISHGKADVRQTLTPAEFVPGGSIGPPSGV